MFTALQAAGAPKGLQIAGRCPVVDDAGTLSAPDDMRRFGAIVAKQLSPECPYEASRFVIKGYFKKYGALYQHFNFPVLRPVVQAFFANNSWERRRNDEKARINRMFTIDRARLKLRRAYPMPAHGLPLTWPCERKKGDYALHNTRRIRAVGRPRRRVRRRVAATACAGA